MERYREIAALRCFTHKGMVQITGSESAAAWQIKSYLQKAGYILETLKDELLLPEHFLQNVKNGPLPEKLIFLKSRQLRPS